MGIARRTASTTLEILRHASDLARISEEWASLARSVGTSEIVQHPIWLTTWWKVFGESSRRQLQVLTAREHGKLVGLVPLVRRVHWYRTVPARRLELLGTGENPRHEVFSEYLGPLCVPGEEKRLMSLWFRALTNGELGGWDELYLPRMRADTVVTRALLSECEQHGMSVTTTKERIACFVPLPSTWEEYMASLSSTRRQRARRALRNFERWSEGTMEFRVARSVSEAREMLAMLEALHTERWVRDGHLGAFSSLHFRDFHDAALPALQRAGALEMSGLFAKGEPVSCLYNLAWNGKVRFYQTGRRVGLPNRVKPGLVIHLMAIRDAIERERSEYDFLSGTGRYKEHLALASRSVVSLRVPRPGAAIEHVRRGVRRVQSFLGPLKELGSNRS